MYGLSLQSGECFGLDGNWSDRLLDNKLVSLGLGLKNVFFEFAESEFSAGSVGRIGGGVAGVTDVSSTVDIVGWIVSSTLLSSGNCVISGISVELGLSSWTSSIFVAGASSFFDLCFNWNSIHFIHLNSFQNIKL